jgi:hypothetical protein
MGIQSTADLCYKLALIRPVVLHAPLPEAVYFVFFQGTNTVKYIAAENHRQLRWHSA